MNGTVILGSQSGTRIRDERYGTLWELVAPRGSPCKQFGFAYVEVDPGQESPAHYHRKTEELYYVTRGSGIMTLGDRTTLVKPGDTVVIPAGEVHKIRAHDEGLAFICVTGPPYDPEDDYEVELLAEVSRAVEEMGLEQLCKDIGFPGQEDWQTLSREIERREQEAALDAFFAELRHPSTGTHAKMRSCRAKSGKPLAEELDERRKRISNLTAQRAFLIYFARWAMERVGNG